MSEPYIGEIRMFAGNYAPAGWMLCNGQLLSIQDNEALFSLLGSMYGGDGRTTFGLPDLRGRLPIHMDSENNLGEKEGSETATVSVSQLPAHTHQLQASGDIAGKSIAQSNLVAKTTTIDLYSGDEPDVSLANNAIAATGGSQSHNNMMPYLCVNFIICLFGIYPSRS